MATAAGVVLGVALAAYPAWVRGSADAGGWLFPVIWAAECAAAATLAGIGIAATKEVWAAAERRLFRATLGSFVLSTLLLAAAGFGWAGDWMRFAAFRSGLRAERLLTGAESADWRVYTWRSWRVTGLENDAYLVFDPSGRLAARSGSGILPGVACPIVADRPMVLPWHLVTTADCVLRQPRGSGRKLDV